MTREQGISLVREHVKAQFVNAGMCADFAIHDTGGGNPHAHIMLIMRPIQQDGAWGAKQKKEYILDPQGRKIYDPKKRQYKCKAISATDWHEQTKAVAWLDRHRDKIELFFLPPYAPESNPDEYLNYALKLSIHSGGLPRTKCGIRHKTASFMRTLQYSSDKVSAFFQHN